jgi:hypothetical protein
VQGLDSSSTGVRTGTLLMETAGPPRFLGDPSVCAPRSSAPVGLRRLAFSRRLRAARAELNYQGSHNARVLSELDNAARRLAVYASQPGSPHDHARLASGWWPAFAGRDWLPAGSHRGFQVMSWPSSTPRLCLAQAG